MDVEKLKKFSKLFYSTVPSHIGSIWPYYIASVKITEPIQKFFWEKCPKTALSAASDIQSV